MAAAPMTDNPMTTDLRIRAATPADLPGVKTLATAAFAHYIPRIGRPPAPMTADYATHIAAGQVWVAELAPSPELAPPPGTGPPAGPAGLLVLVPQPDHLLLDAIAVAPSAQGRGLGGALLAFADTEARSQGRTEIRLYTNQAMHENIAYYPRHGYAETHRSTANGFHRVYFTKQLRSP